MCATRQPLQAPAAARSGGFLCRRSRFAVQLQKREKGSGGHGEALCGPAVLAQRPDGTRC